VKGLSPILAAFSSRHSLKSPRLNTIALWLKGIKTATAALISYLRISPTSSLELLLFLGVPCLDETVSILYIQVVGYIEGRMQWDLFF
jgi:hypothetical protein